MAGITRTRKLTAEEEIEVPPQFRRSYPTEEAAVKQTKPLTPKGTTPEVTATTHDPASRRRDTGSVSRMEDGKLATMPLRV